MTQVTYTCQVVVSGTVSKPGAAGPIGFNCILSPACWKLFSVTSLNEVEVFSDRWTKINVEEFNFDEEEILKKVYRHIIYFRMHIYYLQGRRDSAKYRRISDAFLLVYIGAFLYNPLPVVG